jgi:aspartyl/asparaginyl beta-hydroxylase (cupin superfamily)
VASSKDSRQIMRLVAGGSIGRHSGPAYGLSTEIVRLHVPIVTHADVMFSIAGQSLSLKPGELGYLDTTREHEVHNKSSMDRVHLVLDVLNSTETRDQLAAVGEAWCLMS